MRILVIEDEDGIRTMLQRGLKAAGYHAETAADGEIGLSMAQQGVYSLIILDLMLPKIDGFRVCERLRAAHDAVPILMLTARDQVTDRIRGLDTGADDYLPKPFDFQELLARVRALLRRERTRRTRVVRVADLEIDTGARRVTRSGTEIVLTQREYDLLEALAANAGQVLSREVIQERVWMDEASYSNTVDVYIGLLRKKIDADHAVKLIHTVRGVGYTLRAMESDG